MSAPISTSSPASGRSSADLPDPGPFEGAEALEVSTDDALALVRQAMAGGARLSGAVADVAKAMGVNRKELYAAALADKEKQ